jgi:murein DD-endopeptidase MepM/ murein hydrolase activator NlpD
VQRFVLQRGSPWPSGLLMRRVGACVLLLLGLAYFATADVGSQVAPTTAPTTVATNGAEAAPEPELAPLDPLMLAEAADAGERAAFAIRGRVRELAQARVDVASGNSEAAQAILDAAASRVVDRLARLQTAGSELDQLQFSHRQIVTAYEDARRSLARHAAALYTRNPEVMIANDFLKSGDLELAVTRSLMIRAILDADRRRLIDTYVVAAASSPDLESRADVLRGTSDELVGLVADEELAVEFVAAVNDDLADVRALASDWLFPVAGDHNFIDSFLAPRMMGTPSAHRHQGADVFADADTPLVAVERGVIGRVGAVSLGGLRVWLIGESGANYYYAHLSAFADGLEPGQFVEAGTVLGYVGNTGNAVGTPPHVHFQVHPDGGTAVNPYPLLRQTSSSD